MFVFPVAYNEHSSGSQPGYRCKRVIHMFPNGIQFSDWWVPSSWTLKGWVSGERYLNRDEYWDWLNKQSIKKQQSRESFMMPSRFKGGLWNTAPGEDLPGKLSDTLFYYYLSYYVRVYLIYTI